MEQFVLEASDGHAVACYSWGADNTEARPLVIQIAHGMGEHARRYDWVAEKLVEQGYVVYASDHRGHGGTCGPQPGWMGGDGWNRTLADLFEFNRYIKDKHPGCQLCLLGHSMGSMLSQQYITRYGQSIDALVLSGSPGFKENRFGFIGSWILRFEMWRHEPQEQSETLQNMLFGNNNKPFDAPGATGYEWLSRDPDQVKLYVDDDMCGFVLSVGSLADMFQESAHTQSDDCVDKIPVDLPIYVFSGSDDPVHGEVVDLDRMVSAYRLHGVKQLDYRLYPGGRHEMFNEINRDEVMEDLLKWLDGAGGQA